MKPVFKCDYCSKMGTEKEIREHELECMNNYDRRSCYTCLHRELCLKDKEWGYKCKAGRTIPDGKIYEFCSSYERKESKPFENFGDIFSPFFGHR